MCLRAMHLTSSLAKKRISRFSLLRIWWMSLCSCLESCKSFHAINHRSTAGLSLLSRLFRYENVTKIVENLISCLPGSERIQNNVKKLHASVVELSSVHVSLPISSSILTVAFDPPEWLELVEFSIDSSLQSSMVSCVTRVGSLWDVDGTVYSGIFRFVVGDRVIRLISLFGNAPDLATMSGRFFDVDGWSIVGLIA